MADLDDFFAKKDRKKSTKSKKFATTEELAKKYEDTSKKPETRPTRKQEPAAPVVGVDGEVVPQEEQVTNCQMLFVWPNHTPRHPDSSAPVTVNLGVMLQYTS